MTDPQSKSAADAPALDWKISLLHQIRDANWRHWLPPILGLLIIGFLWQRDWSKPAALKESQSNPVRAASFEGAAVNPDELLLPDQLSLMQQQAIEDRSQQIKSDVARERADRKHPCYRKSDILCVELKLEALSNQLAETIAQDGTSTVSPTMRLRINSEMWAQMTALQALGAKDQHVEKLAQVYLPAQSGDGNTFNGAADTVASVNKYLSKRKVERFSAAGLSDELPDRKQQIDAVRSASAVGN